MYFKFCADDLMNGKIVNDYTFRRRRVYRDASKEEEQIYAVTFSIEQLNSTRQGDNFTDSVEVNQNYDGENCRRMHRM